MKARPTHTAAAATYSQTAPRTPAEQPPPPQPHAGGDETGARHAGRETSAHRGCPLVLARPTPESARRNRPECRTSDGRSSSAARPPRGDPYGTPRQDHQRSLQGHRLVPARRRMPPRSLPGDRELRIRRDPRNPHPFGGQSSQRQHGLKRREPPASDHDVHTRTQRNRTSHNKYAATSRRPRHPRQPTADRPVE